MNRIYLLYFFIVILAFIFDFIFVTNSSLSDAQTPLVPFVQLIFGIPLMLISSIIFYFTKNTDFAIHYNWVYLLIPFLLEIIFFAVTKELFTFFKPEAVLLRCFVYAIGLATIVVYFFNWLYVKFF